MLLVHKARLAVLGTVATFSLLVLALDAWVLGTFSPFFAPGFAVFGLIVAILTLGTIIAAWNFTVRTRGTYPYTVTTEVVGTGVLCLLWLVAAAVAAGQLGPIPLCFGVLCGWQASTAFSFLNWIILGAWLGALVFFGIKGNHWRSDVTDTDLTQKQSGMGAPQNAPVGTMQNPAQNNMTQA